MWKSGCPFRQSRINMNIDNVPIEINDITGSINQTWYYQYYGCLYSWDTLTRIDAVNLIIILTLFFYVIQLLWSSAYMIYQQFSYRYYIRFVINVTFLVYLNYLAKTYLQVNYNDFTIGLVFGFVSCLLYVIGEMINEAI